MFFPRLLPSSEIVKWFTEFFIKKDITFLIVEEKNNQAYLPIVKFNNHDSQRFEYHFEILSCDRSSLYHHCNVTVYRVDNLIFSSDGLCCIISPQVSFPRKRESSN